LPVFLEAGFLGADFELGLTRAVVAGVDLQESREGVGLAAAAAAGSSGFGGCLCFARRKGTPWLCSRSVGVAQRRLKEEEEKEEQALTPALAWPLHAAAGRPCPVGGGNVEDGVKK